MNVRRVDVNCWEFEEGITRAIICKERYDGYYNLWIRKLEIRGSIRLFELIIRLRRWRNFLREKYKIKDFP